MIGSGIDSTLESPPQSAPLAPGVESGSSAPQPAPGAPVSTAPHGGYQPGCKCGRCESTRAKWRAKHYAQRSKRGVPSGSAPLGAPLPPIPPAPGAPDPVVSPGANPAPVPWDTGTLKPLFDELISALERMDVESIAKRAAKVSPEVAAVVRQDASWNGPAKASLHTAGPQVAAKWLNSAGISAENAGEVVLGVAIISIVASRNILLGKLKEMEAKAVHPNKVTAAAPAAPGESQEPPIPFPQRVAP